MLRTARSEERKSTEAKIQRAFPYRQRVRGLSKSSETRGWTAEYMRCLQKIRGCSLAFSLEVSEGDLYAMAIATINDCYGSRLNHDDAALLG